MPVVFRGKELAVKLREHLATAGVPLHTVRVTHKGGGIDVEYITKKGHYTAHMRVAEGPNGVLRMSRSIKATYDGDRNEPQTNGPWASCSRDECLSDHDGAS